MCQIFGPVQSILKFDTFEEVIDRANDTNYGLAAGVITNDITTAMAFAKFVRAGSVWYLYNLTFENLVGCRNFLYYNLLPT